MKKIQGANMQDVTVQCEFCEVLGQFFADNFQQVVLQFEKGQDWNGDLANACGSCARSYRVGRILETVDHRMGLTPKMRELVAIAFRFSNDDPLFKVFLMGKQKFGEGQRWVNVDEVRSREKREREEFEQNFFERNGVTLAEWERDRMDEQIRTGRISALFAGKSFTRFVED
jgi:hypothetical protein